MIYRQTIEGGIIIQPNFEHVSSTNLFCFQIIKIIVYLCLNRQFFSQLSFNFRLFQSIMRLHRSGCPFHGLSQGWTRANPLPRLNNAVKSSPRTSFAPRESRASTEHGSEGPDDITREMSAPAQGATGHRQRFPQGGIWMAKGTNDPQTAIPPALKFGWRKTRTGYGQNRQRRDRRLALRRSSARRGESLNRFSKLRQERGFPDCHSKSSTPNKRGPRLATRAGSPLRQWLYKKIYAPKY